jgi:formiminotetrahydrofolate cyclodeaminase
MSDSFLKELAEARPDPGGGAAAAYGGTLGLALLEKVVRLEANRPQDHRERRRWEETLQQVRQVSQALSHLQEEDVKAYDNLARGRQSGSAEGLAAALREAVLCPLRIVQQAKEGLAFIARTGEHCQVHLVADLLVASELMNAALMGAYHIACANLPLVQEPPERAFLARELVRVCQPACQLFNRVKMELVARRHDFDHCG